MPHRLRLPLALGLLLTLADVAKPLIIDDVAYAAYARQIARDPLDPYGFELFWYQHPEPALEILAPPLVPYWLAPAVAAFGDRPWLWKLWLFPFNILLAWAVFTLCRRFARGLEAPLTTMTVLSPAFLPAVNLMLDVPTVALGLAAVAVFVRGRCRLGRTLLAGLLAGLAIQAKYNGLLAVGAIGAFAVARGVGRRRTADPERRSEVFREEVGRGAVAGLVALGVFVGWELLVAARYGRSHFLFHLLEKQSNTHDDKLALAGPLVAMLGLLAPGVLVLGLAALRRPPALLRAAVAVIPVGFLILAAVPESDQILLRAADSDAERLGLDSVVAGTLGTALLVTVVAVVTTLMNRRRPAVSDLFLVAWLCVEVVGYFALSPFAAARRVMTLTVVLTLLAGRLAAVTCRAPDRKAWVNRSAWVGVAAGVLFAAVDFWDALPERLAVRDAAAWLDRRPGSGGTVWFVGHWGFMYYAEREGWRPIDPDRTALAPGDWLVLPSYRPHQQVILYDETTVKPSHAFEWHDRLPLRTNHDYYAGKIPLQRHDGPRIRVDIYRVVRPSVPSSPPP